MPVKAHGTLSVRSLNAILNTLRDTVEPATDYQLCKEMGWTTSKIGNWRGGRSTPGNRACAQIAGALDIPIYYVIVVANLERERDPELRALLNGELNMLEGLATGRTQTPAERRRRATSRKAGMLAAAVVGFGLFGHPAPAAAAAHSVSQGDELCIMRARRRRRFVGEPPRRRRHRPRVFCTRRRASRLDPVYVDKTPALFG